MVSKQNNIPSNGVVQPDMHKKQAPSVQILAADLLVVDEHIAMPTAEELSNTSANLRDRYARLDALLQELLAKKGMKHGEKISIDAEDFKQLSIAAAGFPAKIEAGG